MANPIDYVEQRLSENSSDDVKRSTERFFREDIKVYGAMGAVVKKITGELIAMVRDKSKDEILNICEELWSFGYLEKSTVAAGLSYSIRKLYTPEDFGTFERWVSDYVHNWANCDQFCSHTISTFLEMYPQFVANLKIWTKSENRWKRRASAVSLVHSASRGLFLADTIAIADELLLDRDDMVQNGYGWMLKAASESHAEEIFGYLMAKIDTMPRTAFRYALEKMPEDWKVKAMAAHYPKKIRKNHRI
jgi:3-methyladenine DNA glycosylase AlkD